MPGFKFMRIGRIARSLGCFSASCWASSSCSGNQLVGRVANPSYISIRRGTAPGMDNFLATDQ